MWTVLLVEDEILVRESVKSIIPWEELGFTVVAEADDGAEALVKIREHQPDLVITDIIMPVMNGVELLKAARDEGYACKFIVLSCMSDFEYVREAMEYGASNYILKLSMNIASLKEALEKVKAELFRASSDNAQALHQYYERIWRRIGENLPTGPDREQTAFPIPNWSRLFFVVAAVMHGENPIHHRMLRPAEQPASHRTSIIHRFSKWGQTTFFLGFADPEEADGYARELQAMAAEWPYPFACSSRTEGPSLPDAWRSVLRELDRSWHGADVEQAHASHTEGAAEEDASELWSTERMIVRQFEQMKVDECCESIVRFFELMTRQRQSMYAVKETSLRLGRTFCRMMAVPFELQDRIEGCTGHAELRELMLDYAREKLRQWDRNFPTLSDHPEINKVIAYIRANYNRELTVKSLAKYVSMDEKYLSGLFKKKTGEVLIHYLQRVRIRRAESYLQTTELSVSDIGAMVGFTNDNYFIKIFRRFHDLTPSQYRKLYHQREP